MRLSPLVAALFVAALVTPPALPAPVAPPPGLVAWWSGDGNAKDLEGHNDGFTQNGASFAAGKVGQAFTFSSNNSDYVGFTDAPSLHVREFTIDAWVNFAGVNLGHALSIFGKAVGGGYSNSYVLWYQDGALRGATGGPDSATALAYGWAPEVGTWYHVAYKFDGATHALYVDGVQVASAPNTQYPEYDVHPPLMGGDYGNGSVIDFFEGQMDEVDLFDRALTDAEILSIYQAGAEGKSRGPSLSVRGVTIHNPSSDDAVLEVPVAVARGDANGGSITVHFQTSDGSAVAGTDYVASAGDLTIAADQTTGYLAVPLKNAASLSSSRAFSVHLSGVSSNAIINHANAAVTILHGYEAARDFSLTTNDASQPWQYGYAAADGTGFTSYTDLQYLVSDRDAGTPLPGWFPYVNGQQFDSLGIVENPTDHTVHYNQSTAQPAGDLAMFPGESGRKSVLRWKAPTSGTFNVQGKFERIDSGDADVAIVVNGGTAAPLLPAQITPSGSAIQFNFSAAYAAGDTVDFIVGNGDDGFSYSGTGLSVAIYPVALGDYRLSVAGTSNLYGAGHEAVPGDGTLPPSVQFQAGSGKVLTFAEVTGTVLIDRNNSNGGLGPNGPDGGDYFAPTDIDALNGLAGIKMAKTGVLIGVFLDDSEPAGAAPATLDFNSDSLTTSFASLAPAVGQPFFIGDGLASGAPQQFQVPATATRLFLGLADGNSNGHVSGSPGAGFYSDNAGAFTAAFHISGVTDAHAHLTISATAGSDSDPLGKAARAGDKIDYTLTVKNDGDAAAKNLQVATVVPSYRRANQTIAVATIAGSNRVSLTQGTTDDLGLAGFLSGAPGIVPDGATITTIEDVTSFTMSAPAKRTAPAKLTVTYGQLYQFSSADLSIANGGHLVTLASLAGSDPRWMLPGGESVSLTNDQGQPRQAIVWPLSSVAPNAQADVSYLVSVTNRVLIPSAIVDNNLYAVFSTSNEPAGIVSARSSAAPLIGIEVRGPIRITATEDIGSTAPGGIFSYTFTVENLSAARQSGGVAVIDLPAFSRFDENYPDVTAGGARRSGVSVLDVKGKPLTRVPAGFSFGLHSPANNAPRQVLVSFGNLAGHAQEVFRISFQAQWAEPSEVPKLSLTNYAAAFLNPAHVAEFKAGIRGGNDDFQAYLHTAENTIAASSNDSGSVSTDLSGSTAGAPQLRLVKSLVSSAGDSADDGEGHRIALVHAGDTLTFALNASNAGEAEAADVFVQDVLPNSCTLLTAKLYSSGPSARANRGSFDFARDPDGHHVVFENLHLAAREDVTIVYTVAVAKGASAPAPGTYLDPDVALDPVSGLPLPASIHSSSTPHSPGGLYVDVPIQVIGPAQFAQPLLRYLNQPSVTDDVVATASTLDTLYKSYPASGAFTDSAGKPGYLSRVPAIERLYVHYENTGRPIRGATLTIPIPAHTVFYRAGFVSLTPTSDAAAPGLLPGKLIAGPAGAKIDAPAPPHTGSTPAEGGNVTFTFNGALAVGAKGDVMVEVIVSSSALNTNGSFAGINSGAQIVMSDPHAASIARAPAETRDGSGSTPPVGATASSAPVPPNPVRVDPAYKQAHSDANVPVLGILQTVPQAVQAGQNFEVLLSIFNDSDSEARGVQVTFPLPGNTQYVGAQFGQGSLVIDNPSGVPQAGDALDFVISTGNGPLQNGQGVLAPRTGAAITITLKATGAAGGEIGYSTQAYAACTFGGLTYAPEVSTRITPAAPAPAYTTKIVGGVLQHAIVNGRDDVGLVALGGNSGYVLAQGASNIVSPNGSNIVAAGAGNIVAAGAGNLTNIGGIPAASLVANRASIVAAGAGNLIAGPGAQIVAAGAGNIVAAGAGNIVAAGAGNIVAAGAGNIVAAGAGNIVAAGAGNIVAAGAGNMIAAGGGSIVAAGAGNIVAAGAGNLVQSALGTSAALRTNGGNLFGAGGAGFRPQ